MNILTQDTYDEKSIIISTQTSHIKNEL